MKPIGCHLILALVGRRVLAPTTVAKRTLVTSIAWFAVEYRILLFHAPDTHLHIVAACDRMAAGRLAQRLETSLRGALALSVPFRPAEIIEVSAQSHLRSLVDYVLGQDRHHGVIADGYHEASVLLDLLGLRCIAPLAGPTLRSLLPRLARRELLEHLGVGDLAPGSSPQLLASSTEAALALPSLHGRAAPVLAARTAAVAVGRDLGLRTERIAELLQVSDRTVQRPSREGPRPELVRAVRLQMGLRERLGVRDGSRSGS